MLSALPQECHIRVEGLVGFNMLAAVPVAILLTIATLVGYRWQIGRWMHRTGGDTQPEAVQAASGPEGDLRTLILSSDGTPPLDGALVQQQSQRGLRAVALIYTAAGMGYAAVIASLHFVLGDIGLRPLRWTAFWIVYVWPVVPVLMLIAVGGVRRKLALAFAYFVVLGLVDVAIEVTGMRYRSSPGELFILWAATMGIPTSVLLLLNNRAWRAAGLLAFLFAVLAVTGFVLVFMTLGCLAVSTGTISIVNLRWPLTAVTVVALMWAGWRVLRAISNLYRAKRLSDQSLTVDSWWLTITLVLIVTDGQPYGAASLTFLLAFLAYKFMVRLGLRGSRPVKPARTLLLLRVFRHGLRSRRLFDDVGQRWRYVGPIAMIGGTDLATAYLEPDELLRFWSGRVREAFVADRAELQARLVRFDTEADPDTRYRMTEFFCHDDNWQTAVRELARRSDAVLMDLRGFSPETHRGCRFELGVLVADVPLERVVLLVDSTTAMEQLDAMLRQQWRTQPADGINRASPRPAVRMFRARRSGRDLSGLLAAVFSATATSDK